MGHGGLLHRALEAEVEVVEGLDLGEAGGLDPVLATVGVSGVDLLGQHGGQVGLVIPTLFGCSLRQWGGPR